MFLYLIKNACKYYRKTKNKNNHENKSFNENFVKVAVFQRVFFFFASL